MRPKRIIKLIKKEAARILPPETYFYVAKYAVPQQGEDGKWRTGEVMQNSVNHGRRLKKIYKKWGLVAVQAYFFVKLESQRKQQDNEQKEDSSPLLPQEGTGAVSSIVD